ncbi:ATP-binding protein [Aestuariivirga sp.]|uniref:ATP-binding protein n=1 Tax=Aestuariivirga sp. TaxID=2650926 RepID=UPI00391C82F7
MTDDPGQRAREDFRLAAFIRSNVDAIVAEWVAFARTRTPASDSMTHLALQDHVVEILTFIADDLDTSQTSREQSEKSKGRGPPESPLTHSAAQIHASLRLADGFDIDQMVSEYRALRASVVKQWVKHKLALAPTDLEDLTRFNEAIDQSVAESVAQYTKMITRSRNLFLGILGHDLRNPISAAAMAARSMASRGPPGEQQTVLAGHIVDATERGIEILDKLLDVTRSAFGEEFRIVRESLDVGQLGAKLVEEMRSISRGRRIAISVVGDTTGQFDAGRIGQLLSNLIGNAIQYSTPASEISVRIVGQDQKVMVSVHNLGDPIPQGKAKTIFQSMTRGISERSHAGASPSLGLGLFIAQKIVEAHGGELAVRSSSEEGTTFTALLPRK